MRILMVEDNDDDILLAELALSTIPHVELQAAKSVVDAVAALEHSRPSILLLDLNLPEISGHQFLASLKQNSTLNAIPVVVLTSSNAYNDVLTSYRLGASCHIVKPVDYDVLVDKIRKLADFYRNVVELPHERARTVDSVKSD